MMSRLSKLFPIAEAVAAPEKLRGAVGALIGLLFTILPLLWLEPRDHATQLIAPMGASAVLLFMVPASPLAQPWAVMGGNLVAALAGLAMAHLIAIPLLAASVAVAVAIFAMATLRCLHPPGGAVALLVALGGTHLPGSSGHFIAVQVGLSSAMLTLAAYIYNNATGHSYPHRAHMPNHPHPPRTPILLTDADYDAVLADYGEALDINRGDLAMLHAELIGRAESRMTAHNG